VGLCCCSAAAPGVRLRAHLGSAQGIFWACSPGHLRSVEVGKGDRKTRRGKIYRGSFGKSRPKDPAAKKRAAAKTATRK
jgi:30S ribosomal protein S31